MKKHKFQNRSQKNSHSCVPLSSCSNEGRPYEGGGHVSENKHAPLLQVCFSQALL